MKFLFAILLSVLTAFSAGCLGGQNENSAARRTVTDDAGRSISIPARPSRIVSLSYGTDEILTALVAPERIRAYSKYAGDEGITFTTKEEAARVGRRVTGELEEILAEEPDLVFVSSGTNLRTVETLAAAGIPVFVSRYPKSWAELEEKLRTVSAAVGEKDKGEALIREMNARRDAVTEKLSAVKEKRRTLALAFRYVAVGKKGTLFADLLALAQADDLSLAIPAGTEGAVFSREQIITADPEVILLPTWNFNGTSHADAYREEIASEPAFAGVSAVRNGRLIFFPDRYRYVTSQHAADALEALAKVLYPEVWEKE